MILHSPCEILPVVLYEIAESDDVVVVLIVIEDLLYTAVAGEAIRSRGLADVIGAFQDAHLALEGEAVEYVSDHADYLGTQLLGCMGLDDLWSLQSIG